MALPAAILEAGTPIDEDLSIARGDTPRIRLYLVDDDAAGAAIDLAWVTGANFVATDPKADATLFTVTGTIESPTTLGQIYFDLSAVNTNLLPFPAQTDDTAQEAPTARFFIEVLGAASARRIVKAGRIQVLAAIDP